MKKASNHITTIPSRNTHAHEQDNRRYDTIRYDREFNVDSKAEYSALSSTRSQKKKLKQTTPMPQTMNY